MRWPIWRTSPGWSSIRLGSTTATGALTVGANAWDAPVTYRSAAGGSIVISGAQTATAASDASFTFSGPTSLGADVSTVAATGGTQDITFSDDVTFAANAQVLAGSGRHPLFGHPRRSFRSDLKRGGNDHARGRCGRGHAARRSDSYFKRRSYHRRQCGRHRHTHAPTGVERHHDGGCRRRWGAELLAGRLGGAGGQLGLSALWQHHGDRRADRGSECLGGAGGLSRGGGGLHCRLWGADSHRRQRYDLHLLGSHLTGGECQYRQCDGRRAGHRLQR